MARKRGALIALKVSLITLAVHQIRIGKFSAAEAYFAESLEITAASGGIASVAVDLYRPLNVELLAWRGDDAGTRAAAKTLIEMGEAVGMAVVQFQAYHALAILELGAGRYSEALLAAEFATDREAIGWRCQFLPLVVEAGLRSGNRMAAERALEELEMRATASETPWALGLLERSQALMADDSMAEELFKQSIAHLKQTLVVTDLAYGPSLVTASGCDASNDELTLVPTCARRMKHSMKWGRRDLRSAPEANFSPPANMPFAGLWRPRTTSLPQELKIAQLASRGATNPEIAAQMFISPSTVDYHLRKIYRKLDITSRRQLERALPL